MQALFIDGPGTISCGDKAEPVTGPGEVLLRIRRVGFCGTDLNTFRGLNPLVSYPRIPGHEIAAEVVEVSSCTETDLRPGHLVTVLPYTACGRCHACLTGRANACRDNRTLGVQQDGAFTELLCVPLDRIVTAPLGMAELALVEPLAVGFHAVARGRVRPEDTVLVFGCGMIGLGAVAGAGLGVGARVIAVDVEAGKLDLARLAGAAEVVNSRTEDLAERVRSLTGGHGAPVVIEAVGAAATFLAAVDLVAFAGRVVYIGYAKAPVSYETKLFVQKELDILGSRNASRGDFERVVSMLKGGRYPSDATITRTVSFSEAADALRGWAEQPGAVTKIHVTL